MLYLQTGGSMEYDIIIIGAGISGSICAYELSKKYNILLVDKKKLPQNKPCVGLIIKEAQEILKQWNIPNDIFCQDDKIKMTQKLFNEKIGTSTNTYWNIDRVKLSKWLLKRLTTVEIKENTNINYIIYNNKKYTLHDKKGNIYNCNILIGADGVNSITRKFLNFKDSNKLLTVQYYINDCRIDDPGYWVFNDYTDYYTWITRKDNHVLFGAGITKNNIDDFHKYCTQTLGTFKDHKEEKHYITFIKSLNEIKTGKKNCYLIGESAGLVCPLSGEGISYAIKSALFLAQTILKGKKKKHYKNRINELKKTLKNSLLLRKCLNKDKTFIKSYFEMVKSHK